MILKLLFLWVIVSSNGYLLKQDDTTIEISEIDAFVHSIPSDLRLGYVARTTEFEKDVFSVLNVNLIYDYLVKNNLLDDIKIDQKIVENSFIDSIDEEFVNNLGYTKTEFSEILKQFDLKKQYVVGYQFYLTNQVDDSVAEELAEEYYMVNSSKYFKPKSIDISQINLDKSIYNKDEVSDILSKIDSKELFTEMALLHSNDPSVKSNQGNLGFYNENQYKESIRAQVFNSKEVGLINSALEDDKNYYLIYVNKINQQSSEPFSAVKDDIKLSIKQKISDREFSNVMATITSEKIDVNAEELAKISNRYDFDINN